MPVALASMALPLLEHRAVSSGPVLAFSSGRSYSSSFSSFSLFSSSLLQPPCTGRWETLLVKSKGVKSYSFPGGT